MSFIRGSASFQHTRMCAGTTLRKIEDYDPKIRSLSSKKIEDYDRFRSPDRSPRRSPDRSPRFLKIEDYEKTIVVLIVVLVVVLIVVLIVGIDF